MSSSSYATISALTVLENPRKVSPRTTVFTCHLYVGSADVQKIQGSLRHYSEEEGVQYPDAGIYQATFTVAKMRDGVDIFTDDVQERAECSFVGDIKKEFYLIGDLNSPAMENFDLARRPTVNVCGAVIRSDSNTATFALDAEQYTAAFADQQKLAATDKSVVSLKSVFPIEGFIPDSPRYKNKKPVPWVKRYISISGYLAGIASSLEGATLQERFRVEVDQIAFLGTQTSLASTPVGCRVGFCHPSWELLFHRFGTAQEGQIQLQPQVDCYQAFP
ncbi:hypothetical protein C8R46DRAFT_1230518 [Mycena filopes]|nr:hypothetical protein C8R46DRAFT_1230518 [Mycena filopes]